MPESMSCCRSKEGCQVALADRGLPRADIVEPAGLHPFRQPAHFTEEMVEGIHDEEQRLVVIDLEVLVDDPFELERKALDVG